LFIHKSNLTYKIETNYLVSTSIKILSLLLVHVVHLEESCLTCVSHENVPQNTKLRMNWLLQVKSLILSFNINFSTLIFPWLWCLCFWFSDFGSSDFDYFLFLLLFTPTKYNTPSPDSSRSLDELVLQEGWIPGHFL